MTDNKHHNDSDIDSKIVKDDKPYGSAFEDDIEETEVDSEQQNSDDNDLQEQVHQLKLQLAAKEEEVLRVAADGMNAQKRLQRELDNIRKYANEKIIKALIPIMDSFDKALEIVNDDSCEVTVEAMVEGTVNTQQSLVKVLAEYGIEIINPVGEKFNPEQHEAMTTVKSDEHEKNTVVNVFQKGYLLHGRVIRAAMVVVAQ